MANRVILPLLVAVLVVAGCSGLGGGPATDAASVEVNGIDTIAITHGNTPVEVSYGDTDTLDVVLATTENGPKLALSKSDSSVDIGTEGGEFRLGIITLSQSLGPKLSVNVPKSFQHNVQFSGSSGSIKLRDLSLDRIQFDTTSGRFDAHGLTAQHISGSTTSGGVSIDFATFATDINLSSTSGNIRLKLNEKQPNLSVRATTTSGSKQVDFTMSRSSDKHTLSGTSGNGEHDVQLKATSGNITVTR